MASNPVGRSNSNTQRIQNYPSAPIDSWYVFCQVKLGLLDDAFVSFDAAAARGQGTPVLTQTYVALLSAGIPLDRLRAGRNDCELARALGQLDRKHEAVGILRDTLHPMRGAQFFPIFLWLDAVVAAIEMGCFDAAEEFRERGARMKGFHFVPTLSFYVKNRHVLASHRVLMTLLKFDPEMNVAGIGPALISLLCSAQHANEAVEVRLQNCTFRFGHLLEIRSISLLRCCFVDQLWYSRSPFWPLVVQDICFCLLFSCTGCALAVLRWQCLLRISGLL